MSKKFAYFISLLLLSGVGLWGFSPSGVNDKDPNAIIRTGQYMVKGPALLTDVSTLNESFESTTFPPAGWIKLNPDGGTGWNRQTNGTTPIPGWQGGDITVPTGGGNACAFSTWNTGGASSNDQWIITPQLTNMQSGDSLKFWLRWWPNTFLDKIEVKISTTTPTVAAMTTTVLAKTFAVGSTVDTGWIQYKFNIGSQIPSGSNIYIGFREIVANNLADGASFSLDLVSVTAGSPPPPVCDYQWSSQTSGTTNLLYSVSAVSDMIGWAGGGVATVRKTTDGGSTWTNANPNPGIINGDIYNIYAWSANDAICTTSPGTGTFIYKTTNGGTNWVQVYTLAGAAAFLNALQMVSPTEGYATGDPVSAVWEFLKTTDGGSTWAQVPTAPAQMGSEAGWNNSFQVLGTNIWWGTNGTRVYHSTNLGATWTSGPTTGTVNTYALHYNDANNGLAAGTAVVKSTNGGTNYTAATAFGVSGNMNGLEGNGTDWWAIRSGTDIYRTTNQGTNWTTAYTQAGAVWQDIDFTVVNGCPKGWAVGTGGVISKMRTTTGISNFNSEIPESFLLKQNFPNPFNPTTNINFSIPKTGFVSLKIYDIAGKEVADLVNEVKSAGNYIVGFNAANLPSGAYFYRIESSNFVDTKKMLLIK